jgi:diguanylate cyclase (GGDEF)-like protein/PAS domain S-box-containing protein
MTDTVHILIIEDNLGDARLIQEMLREAPDFNWRIVHADRLESGLNLLTSASFDVCLLDLNLPDSKGEETLSQIGHFFDLPILVLTGLDNPQLGLEALRHGFQDYLVKGALDPASLSRAIRYALERSRLEKRFNKIFTHSNDAIILFDLEQDVVVEANPKAALLLGYSREGLCGISMTSLIRQGETWQSYVDGVSKFGKGRDETFIWQHRAGSDLHVDVSAFTIREQKQSLVVVIARDMTERKQLLSDLEQSTYYDSVTTLPNRKLLEKRFRALPKRQRRKGSSEQQIALLSLDLKDVVRLHSSLGPAHADDFLRQFAERITTLLRNQDVLARLGQAEFALLIHGGERNLPLQVARRIHKLMQKPIMVADQAVKVIPAIGIAFFEDQDKTLNDLLRKATQASYTATSSEGGIALYSEKANQTLQELLWLERNLEKALFQNELELYFQPVIALHQKTKARAEALLRWFHSERGAISPGQFIPVAEASGLIITTDKWVLAKATQLAALGDFSVSVNVSPQTLQEEDIVTYIQECLQTSGLAPTSLVIELTERTFAKPELTLPKVQMLHSLGITFMMDDFGTGYSSLSYLLQYPLGALKIDRSFIAALNTDPKAKLVARTIIQLAETLGFSTVVEGIETQDQLEWALLEGCELAQGFLLGVPMKFETYLTWLQERQEPTLTPGLAISQ